MTMREGRINSKLIEQLHRTTPSEVATEVARLRAEVKALGRGKKNRRRAAALRARATVLSSRGDLTTPIEQRVKRPTRTQHRHRKPEEFTLIVDAHAGVLAVMRSVEQFTGLTARWTGALGLASVADAGSMSYDGTLLIARSYLEPIADLGRAARAATRIPDPATPQAQLQGREAVSVLVHEAFHAVSPYAARDYGRHPGAEEGLAEILMACYFHEVLGAIAEKPVAEAEPLDYPIYREPLERIANLLGVTAADATEREFYLGVLRRSSLIGRLNYLRRMLKEAKVAAETAEALVADCKRAWVHPDGGEPNRTATQRPPRPVEPRLEGLLANDLTGQISAVVALTQGSEVSVESYAPVV